MLGRLGSTRSLDWTTLSIYLGMVSLGWLMIYAVTVQEIEKYGFLNSSAGKQLIWMAISFFALVLIYSIDWKFWQTFAYLIYGVTLASLVAVLLVGQNIKGATSWFAFGGFSIQPSEFAKFGAALAISAYLGAYKTSLKKISHQLTAFALIAVPAGLILIQPDLGSTVVFLSFFIAMYREGLSPTYFWVGGFLAISLLAGLMYEPLHITLVLLLIGMGILAFQQAQKQRYWLAGTALVSGAAIFLIATERIPPLQVILGLASLFGAWTLYHWSRRGPRMVFPLALALVVGAGLSSASHYAFNNFLKPHQKDRLNVWLHPDQCDPRGSLYNLMQSKMAISSGGLMGKGFLEGKMTKLSYVPEQATDFIFCTIGEEQGFIGSFAIIALFLTLIIRLTILAERQRSAFSRAYAYCLAGIIFVHFFINIGMTMGLVPIIGIPLPLVSRGGSALLAFSIMLGVMLKLDRHRYNI